MHLFQILVMIVGMLMSFGYYPQAYKIYVLRDASSVSRAAMLIFALGSTLWTLYGLLLFDWVIILSFIFGMIGSWLIVILTFIYE